MQLRWSGKDTGQDEIALLILRREMIRKTLTDFFVKQRRVWTFPNTVCVAPPADTSSRKQEGPAMHLLVKASRGELTVFSPRIDWIFPTETTLTLYFEGEGSGLGAEI